MLMNDIDDAMLLYRARLNAAEKAIMNNRDIEKLDLFGSICTAKGVGD